MIEVRARRLFLLTFALTFYGLGASIIEGFVNYPTWHLVGQSTFQAFHQAVGPKVIGFLVAPLFVTSLGRRS